MESLRLGHLGSAEGRGNRMEDQSKAIVLAEGEVINDVTQIMNDRHLPKIPMY